MGFIFEVLVTLIKIYLQKETKQKNVNVVHEMEKEVNNKLILIYHVSIPMCQLIEIALFELTPMEVEPTTVAPIRDILQVWLKYSRCT